MKRISIILIVAALSLPQAGQAGWFRTYGSSGKGELGECVQQTPDGGYVVTGVIGPTGWFFKTDSLGNIIWSDTSTDIGGNWVEQTHDGGFILAGVPDLCRTDSLGETLWTKNFDIYSLCVRLTPDGGYVIVGSKGSATIYSLRLVLMKTNSVGDSLWMREYLLSGWSYSNGNFVEQTSDGGYLIAGYLGDTLEGYARQALWLFKTDSLGEMQWSYIQGGRNWGEYDMATCARVTSGNDYIATANLGLLKLNQEGDTLWVRDYRNGNHVQEVENSGYVLTGDLYAQMSVSNANPGSMWFLKTDTQGSSLWQRGYGSGVLQCVSKTKDKGFILTGGNGDYDLCLIKTDSLGLLGIAENPIVKSDNGWNVPHSIGSYVVLHYKSLPQGFRANVFDVSGRKVDEIRGDGNEGAMTWGINYPPGVYFIQALDNQKQLKTAKVVLVR